MKNLGFSALTLLLSLLVFTTVSYASDCNTASLILPRLSLTQSPVTKTFVGETFSGAEECLGPDGRADSWLKFTAKSSKMFVRVTGSGDLDLALEVVESCGGAILACVNETGASGSETASLSGLTPGSTYYFRTYHVGDIPAISQSFTAAVSYIPTVQLRTEMCGIADYTTNDILKSTQPPGYVAPVVYYQWKFEELEAPYNVYEKISPNPTNPNFRLFWFNEIEYNRGYNVSVRVAVNPDATVGDYGPVCTIEMQENILSTQVQEQYENGIFNFCDVVGADAVQGTERYRWEFYHFQTGTTLNVYGDNNQRLLRLSKVPGLKLATPYFATVYAQMGGMESPAGTVRFLFMNNHVPNTGLRSDYPCGATYPLNMQVQAKEVCNGESYTWRFKNTSQTQSDLIYTRTGGNRFIRLEWVSGLIPGDSYDVEVKARQGGKNGDYSSVCNITIAASTAGFAEQVYAMQNENRDMPVSVEGHEALGAESQIELVVMNNGGSSNEGIVFDIASADVDNITRIELYDLNGRLIAERTEHVVREGNRVNWNIPGFSPGIYLLRAINGQETITQKVIFY